MKSIIKHGTPFVGHLRLSCLLIPMMLLVGTQVVSAQKKKSDTPLLSSPYEGSVVQAGDFYLYNVESGYWLQENNRFSEDWNTHGELGTVGFDVNLTQISAGWQINPKFGHNNSMNGDNFYLDTNDGVTAWTFEPVDIEGVSNAYRIKYNQALLHATAAPEFKLICDASEELHTWQVVSRADRMAYVQTATADDPKDLSWLIRANEFSYEDSRKAVWNLSGSSNVVWNSGRFATDNRQNSVFETWGLSTMTLMQTVTGLPNGKYKVSARACYSPTPADEMNATDLAAYNAGTLENHGFLYANDEEVALKSVYSWQGSGGWLHYHSKNINGTYVIDGVNQFSYTVANDDAAFYNEVEVNVIDGILRLGVKVTGADGRAWVMADKFRLTYYGNEGVEDEEELKALLLKKLDETIADVLKKLDGNIPQVMFDELSQRLYSLSGGCTSSDDYRAAISEVLQLYDSYQPVVEAYSHFKSIRTALESILQQDVYVNQSEVEDMKVSLTVLVDNLERGMTTVEKIEEGTQTVRDEICHFLKKITIRKGKSVDITGLIRSQGMDSTYGWEGDIPRIIWNGISYSNAEFYEVAFNTYQVLPDMPKGNYILKVQAFQRPGLREDTYWDYMNGIDKVSSYIFINDGQTKIKNIMSESSETPLLPVSVDWPDWQRPDGRWAPNGMEGAKLWFDAGYFDTEVLASIPEEGDLTLGLRCYENANVELAWTVFDNFRLYYAGSAIDVTLSENADFKALTDIESANVTLQYEMKEDEWNAMVLPFSLTNEQVQTGFGNGTEIAIFLRNVGKTLVFQPTDGGVEANVPVLVRPGVVSQTGEYSFDGCYIHANGSVVTSSGDFDFVGNYEANAMMPAGSYVFNDNSLIRQNIEAPVKSFHAYIRSKQYLTDETLSYVTDGSNPQRIDPAEWQILQTAYQVLIAGDAQIDWDFSVSEPTAEALQGVSAKNGHVVSIDLSNCRIAGAFPYLFLSLPYLETLDLSHNLLSDDIGIGMAAYKQANQPQQVALKTLDISGNRLSGNIGLFASFMTELKTLRASDNCLEDVYPMISPNVTNLDLSRQTIGRVVDLHLGRLTVDDIATNVPSILIYDHANQTFTPNINLLCATQDDSWAMTMAYQNGQLTVPYVSEQNTYYGNSGDMLNVAVVDNYGTLEGSTFHITLSFDEGDGNFDGQVNVLDLQTDILYIMEDYQLKPYNFTAANLWKDDIINVQDVICLVDMLMDMEHEDNSQGSKAKNNVLMGNALCEAQMYIENGKLILNTSHPVAALDVWIDHADAVVVSKDLERNGFISSVKYTDRGVKLVVYSLSGAVLPVGISEIAVVGTSASYIRSAMLSDREAVAVSVQTDNSATGVNEACPIYSDDTDVYDLQGRKVFSIKPGQLYIQKGHKIIK